MEKSKVTEGIGPIIRMIERIDRSGYERRQI